MCDRSSFTSPDRRAVVVVVVVDVELAVAAADAATTASNAGALASISPPPVLFLFLLLLFCIKGAPEIGKQEVSGGGVEQYVFRFQIAVPDPPRVQKLHRFDQLGSVRQNGRPSPRTKAMILGRRGGGRRRRR
mmetsp:Transcript_21982/g.25149  ORF Transcript_21982/g.25149 Transcript_21982/m.25149 type:complete len:133 (+) Transcript_21982:424-822(+)